MYEDEVLRNCVYQKSCLFYCALNNLDFDSVLDKNPLIPITAIDAEPCYEECRMPIDLERIRSMANELVGDIGELIRMEQDKKDNEK